MRSVSIVVAAALTLSSSSLAYDSIACGPPDIRSDCEGLEAARTPWFSSEHALIWKRTRALAGLPVGVDAPFTVETPTLGIAVDDDWQSLLPAPLDLAATIEARQLEIAVFAPARQRLRQGVSAGRGPKRASMTSKDSGATMKWTLAAV